MKENTKTATAENKNVLKTAEIIDRIRTENPELLKGVNKKQAINFVNLAIKELVQQIEMLEEGKLRIPGLGMFNVRKIERERDGKKSIIRRIIFSPAAKTEKNKG